MPANKPKVFHFKKLDPDRRYLITFEGIKNPEERAGTLTTLPAKISKIGKKISQVKHQYVFLTHPLKILSLFRATVQNG